jgi:hypothetical protein
MTLPLCLRVRNAAGNDAGSEGITQEHLRRGDGRRRTKRGEGEKGGESHHVFSETVAVSTP